MGRGQPLRSRSLQWLQVGARVDSAFPNTFSITGVRESFPFSPGMELKLERNYYCVQQIVKVIMQRSTVRRKKFLLKNPKSKENTFV